jgi:transcriptional regulator with XRE-family HTH domain
MPITDQLRKRVKEATGAGQSLNDLAKRAGVKQPTLHRFASGENPTAALLDKLATYFGLRLCDSPDKPAKIATKRKAK